MTEFEQWEQGGDCKICRKEKYCSKPCRVHTEKVRNEIHVAAVGMIFGSMLNSVSRKENEHD